MIQIEVTKNTILQEDIEFGIGEVTQQRGGEDFVGHKVNAADLPYSSTQTLSEHLNDVDAQYNYIVEHVASDPLAVPMAGLIRKSGQDLIDVAGAVFTPQVIDTASSAEASYTKKLWVKIISGTEHHLKRGSDIIAMFNPITHAQIFSFDYSAIATSVAALFGTAAAEDVGTAAGNVVQLDGSAKLPAVDGSQLTNLPIPPAPVSIPIGGVIMWTTPTPPDNFLECNGLAISRVTYEPLFDVIGETYGPGDGSTTFQVPEMRGEFARGWDNGRGIDTARALGGATQLDAMQDHIHQTLLNRNFGGSGIPALEDGSSTVNGTYSSGSPVDTGTGTGVPRVAKETRPRNVSFMYIIRYQ